MLETSTAIIGVSSLIGLSWIGLSSGWLGPVNKCVGSGLRVESYISGLLYIGIVQSIGFTNLQYRMVLGI